MKSTELKKQIEVINEVLKHALEVRSRLTKELERAESKEFIRANKIKKADVQLPDGGGIPYFWSLDEFSRWCKTGTAKPWCCWNERLYRTSEIIITGARSSRTPARYTDLTS